MALGFEANLWWVPGGGSGCPCPSSSRVGCAHELAASDVTQRPAPLPPPTQEKHDTVCGFFNRATAAGCAPPTSAAAVSPRAVTIDNPGGFSWWIGVRNPSRRAEGATFTLSVSVTAAPCPAACSGHGECLRGRCYC
eukprot:7204232-Pyramimonas_sp.AAC.1